MNETVLVLIAAALLAAMLQSATGIGGALIFAPISFIILGPVQTIVIGCILGLATSLLILFTEQRETQPQGEVIKPMILAAVPVQLAGTLLLVHLQASLLHIIAGVLLSVVALTQLPTIRIQSRTPNLAAQIAVGASAGAGKSLIGINGPILAPYLLYLGLQGNALRDALTSLLLAMNVIALLMLFALVPEAKDAWIALPLLLVTLLGQRLGRLGFHALSRTSHRRLVAVLSLAGAITLIASA